MKTAHLIIFAFSLLTGCGAKQEATPEEVKVEKESITFFPVTSFIKGQIHILDSLPVTPLLITTHKGKVDSAWLPAAKLKPYFDKWTGYNKEVRKEQ